MSLRVILTPEAQSDIIHIDPVIQARILDKSAWMGENGEFLRPSLYREKNGAAASGIATVTIGLSTRLTGRAESCLC